MNRTVGQTFASVRSRIASSAFASLLLVAAASPALAATTLADAPVFSTRAVLNNVALALSVEWPTASRAAYPGANDYVSTTAYAGYFDTDKCYRYNFDLVEANRYFFPARIVTDRTCTNAGEWSGNYLNWASTQAIDPFRYAMTGGYRVVDTPTTTILQKAWHSGQGPLFPYKSLTSTAAVEGATPFSNSNFHIRIGGAGFQMLFVIGGGTGPLDGGLGAATAYNPAVAVNNGTLYAVSIRVRVCDPTVGVEANCVRYGANWKPEGRMQEYANRLRFAAFGYVNDTGNQRDGAVLRARMKFVGPTFPVPGSADAVNPQAEWSATTGVFLGNPDAADATAATAYYNPSTPITNSGVANYLNKFGQLQTGNYKGNDPVGELYYSAQRYFRNLGHVPEWSELNTTDPVARSTQLDSFPVIRNWGDPIQYACQKNFILGIGDIYTHADKHLPGMTNNTDEVVGMPTAVSNDTAVNTVTATNIVGTKQGMGATLGTQTNVHGCCSNNTYGMAGLAYWANITDLRPDLPDTWGKQTIQTLWVDVLEQPFQRNNQYYLAAKYGGFIVPDGTNYAFGDLTALPQAWWATTTDTLTDTRNTPLTQPRPDNYFTAGSPAQMISGIKAAFDRIDRLGAAFTTSFAAPQPQVASTGTMSYAAQYNARNWTGEVTASSLSFDATGTPTLVQRWQASATLGAQLAGTGWNTGRRVVTWNGTAGVPFRHASLTAAQRAALDTTYRAGDDSADYLNYLRGERLHETTSTATGSSRSYRERITLLGDIVGSRTVPVGPPGMPYEDSFNPGYSAYKTAQRLRPTMVYVGANDGMLHAFNGAATGADAGREMFAYVPAATFNGPSTPATPSVNGLAHLGQPVISHRYLVNATPMWFDVDVARTWNGTAIASATPDWRTMLIGGLGKGGRSYYALDVSDPASITTATPESTVATRVMWEFTSPDMGFTFGEAAVVKTRKYGWTVILPSGYNTPDGRGHFFFVNPRTGALLEQVSTPAPPAGVDLGMAHLNAFVLSYKDGFADAVYAGDLQGNIWRVDLTGTGAAPAFPAPVKVAQLTDAAGNPQPVTSRPLIELHPVSRERVILVGTGRLLDQADINSTQEQSFYAIRDGNSARFNRATDLPAGITFPITRSVLVANLDVTLGVTPSVTAPMGWYHDLGRGPTGVAWRIVNDAASFTGTASFAPTLPTAEQACAPSGSSRIFAVNFDSGKSNIVDNNDVIIPFTTAAAGAVTDLRFLSVDGRARLIAGSDSGGVERIRGNFGTLLGLRRLNWREVGLGN